MKPQRVLVVDDEKKIRDLVAAYLRSDGFEVAEAGCQTLDPTMALAFVRSRNFQVLVDGAWVDWGPVCCPWAVSLLGS